MIIEFEPLYNKSVVWLVKNSGRFELFKGSKEACEQFKKKRGRKYI